jgi:hypothetical protein
MSNNNQVCDFGFHAGQPYTAVPVSFLQWMVAHQHKHAEIAKNELKRRQSVVFARAFGSVGD